MASESAQRRIDILLDEATKAVAESNWAVVLNRAENVLRMETENEDARAFMATAERQPVSSGLRGTRPVKHGVNEASADQEGPRQVLAVRAGPLVESGRVRPACPR